MACKIIKDRDSRNVIVNDLPETISNNVTRSDIDKIDVRNIIDTCMKYEYGLTLFIAEIEFYEGNSFQVQQLQHLVNLISAMPEEPM